jgi:hypothetical protein
MFFPSRKPVHKSSRHAAVIRDNRLRRYYRLTPDGEKRRTSMRNRSSLA